MARPVYSSRFGLLQGVFGAPQLLYTQPGGYVGVVKDCQQSVGITTGGYTTGILIQPYGIYVCQHSESGITGAPTTYIDTNLHLVLYEGDELWAAPTSVTADYVLGGYLLELP